MCKINETTNLTRNADLAICFKQKKKKEGTSQLHSVEIVSTL